MKHLIFLRIEENEVFLSGSTSQKLKSIKNDFSKISDLNWNKNSCEWELRKIKCEKSKIIDIINSWEDCEVIMENSKLPPAIIDYVGSHYLPEETIEGLTKFKICWNKTLKRKLSGLMNDVDIEGIDEGYIFSNFRRKMDVVESQWKIANYKGEGFHSLCKNAIIEYELIKDEKVIL